MDINENLYNYNHVTQDKNYDSPIKQQNINNIASQQDLGSVSSEILQKNISENKKKLQELAYSNEKDSKNQISNRKSSYRNSLARLDDISKNNSKNLEQTQIVYYKKAYLQNFIQEISNFIKR